MRRIFKNKHQLWFVLPLLLLMIFFIFGPLIQNIINSFYEFSSFSPVKNFVGLKNYQDMLQDGSISVALMNNVRYAVISVICQVGFGLILAAILEQKFLRKIAPFFRVVYFMPVMISISVIALLFGFIYNPQMGLLNGFLEAIGLEGLKRTWLGNPSTAIYATIAMSQWQSTGYIMMLFIVAMQKIPRELYEAAEIDGAGSVLQFLHVTVPQVRETIFVNILITVSGSMLVFNEPYILTKGGGPGISSITLAVHMYQEGFMKNNMGYASALAVLIFVITAVVSIIQIVISRTGKDA